MTNHSMRHHLPLTAIVGAFLCLALGELGAQQGTRPAARRPAAAQQGSERPENATMKCKDGTYQTSTATTACDANGGILLRYPQKAIPPVAKTLDRGKPRTAEDEKRLAGDTTVRKP